MSVTKAEVKHIARLAKLEFEEAALEELAERLNNILSYFAKLQELDTSAVEPLSHPHEITNVFREDRVEPSFTPEEALQNAPERLGRFFKVPKVIKQ